MKAIAASCLLSIAAATATDGAEPFDFNCAGAWRTAPMELLKLMPPGSRSWAGSGEARFWCAKERDGVKSVSFEALSKGAGVSPAGLRWDRRPSNPTVACLDVPRDWSSFKSLSFVLDSSMATGEIATLAVLSDSPETKWRDFLYFPLRVDWKGPKSVSIPLSAFKSYESPAGWAKVDGLYLFSKAFGCQPNPCSSWELSGLKLESAEPAGQGFKEIEAKLPDERRPDGFVVKRGGVDWQTSQLNHEWPETEGDAPVYAPYVHQSYFQTERALFNYYPKFVPGYPSFAPDGKTYINSGFIVQWKGEDGKWTFSDIEAVAERWARAQGWKGMLFAWTHNQSEKAIRFDEDGDAYVMVQLEALDEKGEVFDWRTRCVLLLHSRDRLKTWSALKLPLRVASFEKMDGANRDCLKRPPVILLADYSYFKGSEPGAFILIPEKLKDGSLRLPQPVKFAESCIAVSQHSGEGNMAVTCGGKVFIVFSWAVMQRSFPEAVKALGGEKEAGAKWKLSILKDMPLAKTLPPIPKDHPGLKQTLYNKNIKEAGSSADGAPAFAVAYDIATREVGKPVFLGCGGAFVDDHNWPAITVDPKGFLHVLMNGHHNPVNYVRSLKPFDIEAWTPPEYVRDSPETPEAVRPHLTYATLNCDKAGNLYSIHRSTTGVYDNHLAVFKRDAATGVWGPETLLVKPFRLMYKVWGQKAMYDPAQDRVCLSFYSQSSMKQLTLDQYAFDLFYWPDHEKAYVKSNQSPLPPPASTCAMMTGPASEICSLVFNCPDGRWKLAVSSDFK